jgi:hypothetical protein
MRISGSSAAQGTNQQNSKETSALAIAKVQIKNPNDKGLDF